MNIHSVLKRSLERYRRPRLCDDLMRNIFPFLSVLSFASITFYNSKDSFIQRDLIFGLTSGFCFMTAFLLTLHFLENCSWPENKYQCLNPPLYSPDFTPYLFFMLPKLRMSLKGSRFESLEDIQNNLTAVLK